MSASDRAVAVRLAVEGDIPGIVRVYVCAYAQPPWNERNEPAPSEDYLRWVMRQPGTFTFVAARPALAAPAPAGPALGAAGAGGPADVLGFCMAGPRSYADFVEDWQRTSDRPPGDWPVITGRLGYIWEIAVDPDAQRAGTGTRLLEAALDGLRQSRCERVVLRSSERAEAAVALYRRFGFQRLPLRERRDPLAGPWLLDLTRPAAERR